MPRSSGSLGSRVARAAAAGGRRPGAYRGQRPVGWYFAMALITAVGLALVVYSKSELSTAVTTTTAPVKRPWFIGLAVDICGTVQPVLPQNANYGAWPVHTQGSGVIRVEVSAQSKGTTLGSFVLHYPGMVLNASTLQMPHSKLWANGDRCGSRAGQVVAETWHDPATLNGAKVAGNPSAIALHNLELVTVGFVAKGTRLPRPSKAVVTALDNAESQAAAPTTSSPTGSIPVPSTGPVTNGSTPPHTVPATVPASGQPGSSGSGSGTSATASTSSPTAKK